MEADILNLDYRKKILDEIYGDENINRKRISYKASEIYNKRSQPFVDAKLKEEFPDSWSEMRRLYSINIAQRMTEKMASVYTETPQRTFHDERGEALSEEQNAYLNDIYEKGGFNTKLGWANQVERFQNQAIVQVLPINGMIGLRVYQPHQIDVIPKDNDPESAEAYIISAYDRSSSLIAGDGQDQKIADRNDKEQTERAKRRHVWWSTNYNFITDGNGELKSPPAEIDNPVKALTFVDLAKRKENEFWCRAGNGIIDFSLEFSVILSDVANINRLQGYAQGVIMDHKKPEEFVSGPNRWMFLQLPSDPDMPQPSAQFISPNADLASSLEFLDKLLNFALTSEGIDPKSITSSKDGAKYSSALERFLAQVEAFEPSKKDLELFRTAEAEIFKYVVLWANHFQGASNSPLTKLEGAVKLPEKAYLQIQFAEPKLIQSPAEQETQQKTRMEMGVASEVMAVMELYSLDEEGAIAHLEKVREHKALLAEKGQGQTPEAVQVNEAAKEGGQAEAEEAETAQPGEGGRASERDGRGVA